MRSRYSAFVTGDVEHLLRTWHPSTRPSHLDLDPSLRWYRLEVLATSRGSLLDTEGTVEFRAHLRSPDGDGTGSQHEVSRFVRQDGSWWYLDGTTDGRRDA